MMDKFRILISFSDIKDKEKIFNVVNSLIQKNYQTNDKVGFLTISRQKFSSDYIINDISFLNIVKEIAAK